MASNSPALTSNLNSTTRGKPVLNGRILSNDFVFPASSIPALPSNYIGASSRGYGRLLELCFVFAAGAIESQRNFDLIQGEDEVTVSSIISFISGTEIFEGIDRQVFNARINNANVAVECFFGQFFSIFGNGNGNLENVQLILYLTDDLLEDQSKAIWHSKRIDASRFNIEAWRRMLGPMVAANYIDEFPEGIEGYGPGGEVDFEYNIIVLKISSCNVEIPESSIGKFSNLKNGLLSLFIQDDERSTSWNVNTNSAALIKAYRDLETSSLNFENLVGFQSLVSQYLLRNGMTWNNFWGPKSPLRGPISSYITNAIWLEKMSGTPLVLAIINHVLQNRPWNGQFINNLRKLGEQIIKYKTNISKANKGGAIPDANTSRHLPSRALLSFCLSHGASAIKKAVSLPFSSWQGKISFHSYNDFEEFIQSNASIEDPIVPVPKEVLNWPFWNHILLFDNRKHKFTNSDFKILSDKVLLAITNYRSKVIQSPQCINNLVKFKKWWLSPSKSRNNGNVFLNDFLINFNKF